MLKNTQINRAATLKVAKALGELNGQVVYVGGAMVSLYINDPAAEDIRPTKDIDLTFQITSASKLEDLREILVSKGFVQTHEDDVICRFRFEDLLVDVMSTQAVGWAPSNRWFAPGFELAQPIAIDDIEISILPIAYFLATKMDALFDRGLDDLYASRDLEDIVYIFNHTTDLVAQIQLADILVGQYLKEVVGRILMDDQIIEVMPGHLFYQGQDERMEIILNKMKQLVD